MAIERGPQTEYSNTELAQGRQIEFGWCARTRDGCSIGRDALNVPKGYPPLPSIPSVSTRITGLPRSWHDVRNAWQRGGGRIKPVMAAFEGCAEITRMSRCHLPPFHPHPFRFTFIRDLIPLQPFFPSLLFHDSIRRFEDHAWFTIFGFSNWFLLSDGGRIFKKFCREYCCFILWTGTSIRFEDNQIISFRRKIFGKFALVSYTNES